VTGDRLRFGAAGWGVATRYATEFPAGGSHLERYARRFSAVEITSSFYRHHRLATYQRWAQRVGPEFRFSVKIPKALTHHGHLGHSQNDDLDRFLLETAGLGPKLRVLLVQLPPSLEFVSMDAERFFATLRQRIDSRVAVVCEPRHASWNSDAVEALFKEQGVSRAAVDPARWAEDALPGGDRRLAYFRMHGSPRIYFSAYERPRLEELARRLEEETQRADEVWCIFDNTAHGHALGDALAVQQALTVPR
jgi:uncharacterized protein YecE (DUF72 family)